VLVRGMGTVALQIASLILVARLAPEDFGVITLALAATEVIKVFADFGVDTVATREFALSRDAIPQSQRDFVQSVKQGKWLGSLLGFGALLTYLYFANTQRDLNRLTISAGVGLLIIINIWGGLPISFFQGKLRMPRIVAPAIIVAALSITFVVVALWLLPISPLLAVLALITPEAAGALVLWQFMRRDETYRAANSIHPQTETTRIWNLATLLRRSLPVGVMVSLIALYTKLDTLAVGAWQSDAALGNYGFATRVIAPFELVAGAFSFSVFSQLASLIARAAPARDLRRLAFRYAAGVAVFGATCAALIALAVPPLIHQFRPSYADALTPLLILCAALVLRVTDACLARAIHAYGRFDWSAYIALANLVLIALLMFILVPRYGIVGAAIGSLISECVMFVVHVWAVRRLTT
jgi:O-antigen/teichoic acid export membrane protein